jgi:hypothetical protein
MTDELKWIRMGREAVASWYTLRRGDRIIAWCIWEKFENCWEFHGYRNGPGALLDAKDITNPPLDLCTNLAILKGDEV